MMSVLTILQRDMLTSYLCEPILHAKTISVCLPVQGLFNRLITRHT